MILDPFLKFFCLTLLKANCLSILNSFISFMQLLLNQASSVPIQPTVGRALGHVEGRTRATRRLDGEVAHVFRAHSRLVRY